VGTFQTSRMMEGIRVKMAIIGLTMKRFRA